jgi:CTP synthase
VIATMAEQKAFVEGAGDLGGTMRLGAYPADLAPARRRRGVRHHAVDERHRHRYEVNNAYREQLEAAGLVFSGTSPDGTLVEFVELPADVHPYYVATQAHPEFKSRPTKAAPAVRRVSSVRRIEAAARLTARRGGAYRDGHRTGPQAGLSSGSGSLSSSESE